MWPKYSAVPSMNDSPPPYSAESSSTNTIPDPVVCNPLMQLRRYVIEIMGFTFDADFSLLNHALGQTMPTISTPPVDSILTADERTELLKVATLMKSINAKVSKGGTQWLTIRSDDREAVADAVVRPAYYLGLPTGYILEIISTYAAHQCDESKRSLSFISQKKPYFYRFWRSLAFLGPFNFPLGIWTNHLWSHAHVINIAVPNEEVRIVLGEAMQVYQKDVLGIKDVQHIEHHFERDEWRRVEKVLISEDERKRIRNARWSRERKEADRKVDSHVSRYSAGM